jgi:transposase
MDQASWHKKLKVPENIEIIFLPPYSPELNPIERFWLHIKTNVLRNKIYTDLDLLEQSVIDFLMKISGETVQSVCNCTYV